MLLGAACPGPRSRIIPNEPQSCGSGITLATILLRLWRRTVRRIRTREELWNGNRESWRNAFLGRESLFAWAIRTERRNRTALPARFARPHLRELRVV
ncbi:MAG: hypothetical protein H0V68_06195, partial [Actinobacteria bacterium]|nr:hypothetical protein [Actinomycetota bacterium]